jgi:uncharacterized protein YegP (UPF0339 family)
MGFFDFFKRKKNKNAQITAEKTVEATATYDNTQVDAKIEPEEKNLNAETVKAEIEVKPVEKAETPKAEAKEEVKPAEKPAPKAEAKEEIEPAPKEAKPVEKAEKEVPQTQSKPADNAADKPKPVKKEAAQVAADKDKPAAKPAAKQATAEKPAPKAKQPAKEAAPAKEEAKPAESSSHQSKFIIRKTENGNFVFRLIAPNRETIATGEAYTSLGACKTGIASIQKIVQTAEIEDQTVAKPVTVANPKWEIYIDEAGLFRFRLRARNGEIVAVSASYKTKANCKNGIKSISINAPTASVVREEDNK